MKKMIAVGAALSAIALTGCSSSTGTSTQSSSATAQAPSTSTTTVSTTTLQAAPVDKCPKPLAITDPVFAAAVASVQLPEGVRVTTGRLSKDSGHPGMQAAAIDICDPSIKSADGIRQIATQYAKALKASPIAESLFAVYVASYYMDNGKIAGEVKVKDSDFQLHLWNGNPSPSAELKNWTVVTE
ncbi:hypothetical protein ACFWAY_17700 [Rhodococcus sp. NPDC059968]|uniref:hypothetical protein n=1 Tax=Rhodococcus sp. NPDC059968 TaxID=3347017 RepID=UPI00366E88B0